MKNFLFVFIGGGVGSMLRYGMSLLFPTTMNGFPYSTLASNILGCILIGLLWGYSEKNSGIQEMYKSLLVVGLCGGFTTFSAFSKETLQLIQQQQTLQGILYMVCSLLFCLLATSFGYWCIRYIG